MPEGVEIELYRRHAERVVGHRITSIETPDAWFVKGVASGDAIRGALLGARVTGCMRIGKLLLLDTTAVPLGLRFGMTGRLIVDGTAAIDELEYGSSREVAAWDRVALRFSGGHHLRISDPRRLGGVELAPDTARLGPDVFAVSLPELRAALAGSHAPIKARLMDQHRIAGVGNLIADEVLWRAAIAPTRPAGSLDGRALGRLHRTLRAVVDELLARGGSHRGDLPRQPGARCPRDSTALARSTVGGRTTVWCPRHQR